VSLIAFLSEVGGVVVFELHAGSGAVAGGLTGVAVTSLDEDAEEGEAGGPHGGEAGDRGDDDGFTHASSTRRVCPR